MLCVDMIYRLSYCTVQSTVVNAAFSKGKEEEGRRDGRRVGGGIEG